MSTPKLVADFRAGLERGDLLIQRCNVCGKLNMYPRYACPFCQSEELGWHKASGRGSLYSFTVLRMGAPQGFENDLPYALAVVRLEEGVQMLARLVADGDGEWRSYQCEDPIEFTETPVGQAERRPCAWFKHVEK